MTIILFQDDDEIVLPHKWAICGTCRGNGKHSLRMGAITCDVYDQWDQDEIDDYFAGVHDVQCDDCSGTGKVEVADFSQMTPEQVTAYKVQLLEDRDYQAIAESELRYGC